jgi:hypothetical protein
VIIGARKKWSNKNKTWIFIGMKKIGIESVRLVTFVLRIGCTIDTTRVGILRHDERTMKFECNRKEKDEDSRKNLELEKKQNQRERK